MSRPRSRRKAIVCATCYTAREVLMFLRIFLAAAFALALNAQDATSLVIESVSPVDGGYELNGSYEGDPIEIARLVANQNAYRQSTATQKGFLLSQIAAAERSNDLTKLARLFGQ